MSVKKINRNISMMGGVIVPTPEETEINKNLYPERYSDKPYPEWTEEEMKELDDEINERLHKKQSKE